MQPSNPGIQNTGIPDFEYTGNLLNKVRGRGGGGVQGSWYIHTPPASIPDTPIPTPPDPPTPIKSLRRYLRITTYRHLYTYIGSYRYLHTPYTIPIPIPIPNGLYIIPIPIPIPIPIRIPIPNRSGIHKYFFFALRAAGYGICNYISYFSLRYAQLVMVQ